MKIKELLKIFEDYDYDPESRIVINDEHNDTYNIESIAFETDVDHDEDEPWQIAVIYPKLYKYVLKLNEANPVGRLVKFEIPEHGDFEFRSNYGLSLTSWKEDESIYWVLLPDEEVEEIRAYKI